MLPNKEIIFINDGSKDNTLEIIKEYEHFGIKILDQPNKGQNVARNIAYRESTGDFIKFMDADDIINNESIELQINALNGDTEHIAYGEWCRFYNDNHNTAKFKKDHNWQNMSPVDFLVSEKAGPMLQPGIMLVPRNIIEKAGLWTERLRLYDDTEFYFRLLLNSKGTIFTPGAKLYYRSGLNTNLSSKKEKVVFESTYEAVMLMSENLLKVENSKRTRKLLANMLQIRVHEMYPLYPDLGKIHEEKIKELGGSNYKTKSGLLFNILRTIIGWRKTLLLKNLVESYRT